LKKNKIKIRLTFYGWIVVFLLVWIPTASMVTANNFLLIIFLMIAGFAVASDRLARSNLKSHELFRRFPDEIYAETHFQIEYFIIGKNRRSSFALEFSENSPLGNLDSRVTFYRVDSGESARATKFLSLSARGDTQIESGMLSSRFPFNLAIYSRPCGFSESIIVFPHVEPINTEIPPEFGQIGSGLERADPFGTIPYNFREYVDGDPFKHIDWKKSAHAGTLITRILSEDSGREICIKLPQGASERAISRAASLIVHFGELRRPVSMQCPGIEIGPGSGREFTRRLLTILARWNNNLGKISDIQPRHATTVKIDRSGEFIWMRPGELDEAPERILQNGP
jgi:uncharacterized protein (DUF58 family)